jgi:hypothetical protein
MAVGGIEPEALARAAQRFMRGEVGGHNRSFAPSCAEFAEECRTQELIIAAKSRPRIEKKESTEMEHPLEHRMRMLDNMRLLYRFMKGDEGAGLELVTRGYKIEGLTHG